MYQLEVISFLKRSSQGIILIKYKNEGGENFGLDEEIRISWEIQSAGRFVQLIQLTFRQTVLARASS